MRTNSISAAIPSASSAGRAASRRDAAATGDDAAAPPRARREAAGGRRRRETTAPHLPPTGDDARATAGDSGAMAAAPEAEASTPALDYLRGVLADPKASEAAKLRAACALAGTEKKLSTPGSGYVSKKETARKVANSATGTDWDELLTPTR